MADEQSLFDRSDADARAEADVAGKRLVGHIAVRRWLASWGTGTRLKRPYIGD